VKGKKEQCGRTQKIHTKTIQKKSRIDDIAPLLRESANSRAKKHWGEDNAAGGFCGRENRSGRSLRVVSPAPRGRVKTEGLQ